MTKPYEPDDPSILVGTAVPGADLDVMAESLVEEFVRMGMDDSALWRLFRSPNYRLTHAILRSKGEEYVRELIDRVRARWGHPRFGKQRGRDA